MKSSVSAIVAVLLFAVPALPQETNSYPKSRLELFEAITNAVLIKGTDDTGAVAGKLGVVTVKCRETKDVSTGHREFGVIVTVTETEAVHDRGIAKVEDTTVVD